MCIRDRSCSGCVSDWPKSDWYHLKLPGTSCTPMIVHVRFIAPPLSKLPRQAGVDYQLANVQAPHLEEVDAESAYPPASHGKCADGETSDGNGTNRRTPERQRAQRRGPNGNRARRARLNHSRFFLLDLFVFVAHDAPRCRLLMQRCSRHLCILSPIDAKHISFP